MKTVKLNYDDITIVPEKMTTINSRSECNPYDENGMLPIFVAPMSSVVNLSNVKYYYENKINVVIPRTEPFFIRKELVNDYNWFNKWEGNGKPIFISFSMSEAKSVFLDSEYYTPKNTHYICIDIANGHMKSYIDICANIKERYGDKIVIMAGNIANPNTIELYEKANIDYVRVSIGTGSGCTTSSNTGIHYPIFSLLKACYDVRHEINGKIKIIADGGIKGYRDIQKALIYADYVMIGGLFGKCIESASVGKYGNFYFNIFGKKILNPFKTLIYKGKTVKEADYDKVINLIKQGKTEVVKSFYGMSTKTAQKEIAKSNKLKYNGKTSEGREYQNKVEYSIKGWVENETSYLRSAMSYTNSYTLNDYKKSNWVRLNSIRYNN